VHFKVDFTRLPRAGLHLRRRELTPVRDGDEFDAVGARPLEHAIGIDDEFSDVEVLGLRRWLTESGKLTQEL